MAIILKDPLEMGWGNETKARFLLLDMVTSTSCNNIHMDLNWSTVDKYIVTKGSWCISKIYQVFALWCSFIFLLFGFFRSYSPHSCPSYKLSFFPPYSKPIQSAEPTYPALPSLSQLGFLFLWREMTRAYLIKESI